MVVERCCGGGGGGVTLIPVLHTCFWRLQMGQGTCIAHLIGLLVAIETPLSPLVTSLSTCAKLLVPTMPDKACFYRNLGMASCSTHGADTIYWKCRFCCSQAVRLSSSLLHVLPVSETNADYVHPLLR